jgi:drug/metabolite transporter (DMT)-like permease
VAVLLARRERLPRGHRTWAHLSVAAVLNNVIPFSLFGYAEQRIGSGLAGICNASAPLFAAVVAFMMLPDERLSPRRAGGLVAGFAGVFTVLGAWAGLDGHDLAGALMALGGGLCYGIGFPYTRRFLTGTGSSSLSLAAGQLLCGTAFLAVMTPVLTSAPARWSGTAVSCVLLLGALGTGLAYLLNYGIISAAGATIATTVGYVLPLVSVLAGFVILGERLTWNEPVGAAIVVAGAALTQARPGNLGRSEPVRGGAKGPGHEEEVRARGQGSELAGLGRSRIARPDMDGPVPGAERGRIAGRHVSGAQLRQVQVPPR